MICQKPYDFFKSRRQANGALSEVTSVLNGVSMGTVLRPLLFVALLRMPSTIQSATLSNYVDDTEVSQVDKDPDANSKLQKNLNAM